MDRMPEIADDMDEAESDEQPETETEQPTDSEESEPVETDDEGPSEAGDDIEEAEVELSEDDLGGGDLFDGIEESEDDGTDSTPADDRSDGDDGAIADGLDGNSGAMEEAINDGAARLAVVGLTDEDFEESNLDKSTLETEFRETFEAFRLGYFGSRAVDEYVLSPQDKEVDPAWGFCGAVLMAGAMVVWMRPDGDETLGEVQQTIESITGGFA